jgi:hypothetical protein
MQNTEQDKNAKSWLARTLTLRCGALKTEEEQRIWLADECKGGQIMRRWVGSGTILGLLKTGQSQCSSVVEQRFRKSLFQFFFKFSKRADLAGVKSKKAVFKGDSLSF